MFHSKCQRKAICWIPDVWLQFYVIQPDVDGCVHGKLLVVQMCPAMCPLVVEPCIEMKDRRAFCGLLRFEVVKWCNFMWFDSVTKRNSSVFES